MAARADKSSDEFGQAAGAGADIEHAISGLQGQRADEEFAVMKLEDAGLLVGASKLGRVPFKADDAGGRHRAFQISNEPSRRPDRDELYVARARNVDEMDLRCSMRCEHEYSGQSRRKR
ncbi:hypothetical protein [Bradyrhizobium sp. USDA 4341]